MRLAGIVVLFVLALTRAANADFHGLLGAACARDIEAVRALLEQGVDPDPPYEGYSGYTPLMCAAGNGDPGMTRLLLAAGAETEHRDNNGERALQWAARSSYMNHYSDTAEAARLLLEAGSPPDSDGDANGSSPLMAVNRYGSDPVMTRHLIAFGADVNRRNSSGESPLYNASGAPRGVEAVHLLLQAGAKPDIRVSYRDETPLHRAALRAGPQTVRLLVEAGAETDEGDRLGETALFIAAGRGDVGVVDMLVSLGAGIDAPAASGLTPVLAAITGRYEGAGPHIDAALLLANRTADIDRAFAAALWAGMPGLAQRLHERGADASAVDHFGRSALAGAVEHFNVEWYHRLVAEGADLARFGGETLGVAARRGSGTMVHHFLELGVPADARDGERMTALLHAARHGHVSTLRLLLERGASPYARDGRGLGAGDHMKAARAELEAVIERAGMTKGWRDVSAERTELARLEAAHAEIRPLLGL